MALYGLLLTRCKKRTLKVSIYAVFRNDLIQIPSRAFENFAQLSYKPRFRNLKSRLLLRVTLREKGEMSCVYALSLKAYFFCFLFTAFSDIIKVFRFCLCFSIENLFFGISKPRGLLFAFYFSFRAFNVIMSLLVVFDVHILGRGKVLSLPFPFSKNSMGF